MTFHISNKVLLKRIVLALALLTVATEVKQPTTFAQQPFQVAGPHDGGPQFAPPAATLDTELAPFIVPDTAPEPAQGGLEQLVAKPDEAGSGAAPRLGDATVDQTQQTVAYNPNAWHEGPYKTLDMPACPIFPPGPHVAALAAHTLEPGRKWPVVGNVYSGLILSLLLAPCAPTPDYITTRMKLPPNTQLAIGGSNRVRCYYGTSLNQLYDVTNQAAANCPAQPQLAGDGYYELGGRQIDALTYFLVQVPLRSTAMLNQAPLRAQVGSALMNLLSMTVDVPVSTNSASGSGISNTPGGELSNISTRGRVGQGDRVMIAGFIVADGVVEIALRAKGPSLASQGVPNTLSDPMVEIWQDNRLLVSNDNWRDGPTAGLVAAAGLAPPDNREAAMRYQFPPGAYTAIVRGAGGRTGIALVEAFKVGGAGHLSNISTRSDVGRGDDVMIAGFIVRNGPRNIVIRAKGPSLAQSVGGTLSNPTVKLYRGSQLVKTNDNWRDNAAADVQSLIGRNMHPSDDRESALMVSLLPGAYTAIIEGAGGNTGIALVEVFDLR